MPRRSFPSRCSRYWPSESGRRTAQIRPACITPNASHRPRNSSSDLSKSIRVHFIAASSAQGMAQRFNAGNSVIAAVRVPIRVANSIDIDVSTRPDVLKEQNALHLPDKHELPIRPSDDLLQQGPWNLRGLDHGSLPDSNTPSRDHRHPNDACPRRIPSCPPEASRIWHGCPLYRSSSMSSRSIAAAAYQIRSMPNRSSSSPLTGFGSPYAWYA